jgi:hypothetical protein
MSTVYLAQYATNSTVSQYVAIKVLNDRYNCKKRAVQSLNISTDTADTLSVTVMPNLQIVAVKDKSSGLCYALAKQDKQWSLVYAGTVMPENWTPEGFSVNMVEIDNTKRWFQNNCNAG